MMGDSSEDAGEDNVGIPVAQTLRTEGSKFREISEHCPFVRSHYVTHL
jgi:hypothetical protein